MYILTMEICARVDDKIKYGAPLLGHYSSTELTVLDSEGIGHNVPGSRFEKWRVNAVGFRGEEINFEKPRGIKRIACMGVSETFGLYESPQMEWPRQLEEVINSDGKYEIMNTAVVGLGLKQYVRYLEKYVLRLEPDIVILYVNPFGYGVGVEEFDRRQGSDRREAGKGGDGGGSEALLSSIVSNLRIIPKVKQSVKRILPRELLRKYRLVRMKKQIQNLESARLHGGNALDSVSEESVCLFREDLEEVVRFLLDRGVQVILSSYPVLISEKNIEEYMEIFLDHRRFYIELSVLGLVDASRKFDQVVETVAAEVGAGFVDSSRMVPKSTEYFADNVHYTDEGARLVAVGFANHLRSFPE